MEQGYQGAPPGWAQAPGYGAVSYEPWAMAQAPGYGAVAQAPGYGAGFEQQQHLSPEEEEATRKKLRRKRLREEQKLQNAKDAQSTVWWLCGLNMLNSLLLLVPISGNSWAFGQFTGLGISSLEIRTSCLTMEIDFKCKSNLLEENLFSFICKVGKQIEGRHSLHEAKSMMCALGGGSSTALAGPCSVFDRLFYGSYIIFVTFGLAIACSVIGGTFIYHYWYNSPLEKVRTYAMVFMVCSPIFSTVGLVSWTAYTPDLKEIMNHWINRFAGSELSSGPGYLAFFSYKAVPTTPFGWCWKMACTLIVFQLITMMIYGCFFQRSDGEEAAEAEEERKDALLEERLMAFEDVHEAEMYRMLQQKSRGPAAYPGPGPPTAAAYPGAGPPAAPRIPEGLWSGPAGLHA